MFVPLSGVTTNVPLSRSLVKPAGKSTNGHGGRPHAPETAAADKGRDAARPKAAAGAAEAVKPSPSPALAAGMQHGKPATEAHSIYGRLLEPFGIDKRLIVDCDIDCDVWRLGVYRRAPDREFGKAEGDAVREAVPSIVAHARRFVADGARAEKIALEALSLSGAGVVLIDRRGRPFVVNARAQALDCSVVPIHNGVFQTRNKDVAAEIQRVIDRLLLKGDMFGGVASMTFPRPNACPLLAHVVSLPALRVNPFAACRGAMIIVDPAADVERDAGMLGAMFGLSSAEARLAIRFALGAPLKETAEALDIATATARNHLKAIYAKTGTRRQAELMLLLMRVFASYPATMAGG